MKKYGNSIALISGLYVFFVVAFLVIAFLITNGTGWEFVSTVVIAIMTFPIYISIIAAFRYIDVSKKSKLEKNTLNVRFEKVLSIISLCLIVISVLSLIAMSVALAIHIKSRLIRHMISDIAPYLLIFGCIGNSVIMLDRPLSTFILQVARKRNPLCTIESRKILAVRIVLPAIAIFSIPLILLISKIIGRL